MSRVRPLRGACNCGRIQYAIVVPSDATERAQIFFDDSNDSRRSQATPLTAWLRVPLTWYSSATQALFPDETHSSIRRTFTPIHNPHCQRVFCGYCGTHLSYWTEQPPSEADYVNVTLGSLLGEDIRALEELDLLPEGEEEEGPEEESPDLHQGHAVVPVNGQQDHTIATSTRYGRHGGLDWFEEMIHGSRLGRTHKTRRGVGVSQDGSSTVQWEISEYEEATPDADSINAGAKRKIGEVGVEDDVTMKE